MTQIRTYTILVGIAALFFIVSAQLSGIFHPLPGAVQVLPRGEVSWQDRVRGFLGWDARRAPKAEVPQVPAVVSESLEHRLSVAAMTGDLISAARLLEDGVVPDAQDAFGVRPLERAVVWGHSEMVRLLLDRGAEVNRQGRLGLTALMLAASQGDLWIVKTLMDYGADVNAESDDGETPFSIAMKKGNFAVVEILKGEGALEVLPVRKKPATPARHKVVDSLPRVPEVRAVKPRRDESHLEEPVTALLEGSRPKRDVSAGANFVPGDPLGREAVDKDLSLMTEPVIDVKHSLPPSIVPAPQAFESGDKPGHEKDVVNVDEATSSMKVIEELEEELEFYFREIRDLEKTLLENFDPVVIEAEPASVPLPAKEPAPVAVKEKPEVRPASPEIRRPVRSAPSVQAPSAPVRPRGRRQFFQAVMSGDAGEVESLLREGANANARSALEMTPLMMASQDGHTRVVEALLRHGADVHARNVVGQSAMNLALLREQHEIASLLRRVGAAE